MALKLERGCKMGRFYNGDIEGKFWVALQPSDAAEQFGGYMELSFSFTDIDIDHVKERLKELEDKKAFKKIDALFKKHTSYNDEMLTVAGISTEALSNYADYQLGKKILKCLQETGECNFTAEL